MSCVVGEAVLYEIKTKKLQKNALEVGNFFLNSLLSLKVVSKSFKIFLNIYFLSDPNKIQQKIKIILKTIIE